MPDRFWVTGGTGNWNSTTNWSATSGGASGASVPGSADAAILNASSGSGTVTLDISPVIQTLTCTGFTGTLAFGTNTISLNSTGTIFTGATTMTVTGTPLIICTNSSATARTILPGTGITEANSISFRVTAGTGTFTISTTPTVRDLDFTDGVNPTGFAGSLTMATTTIFGSFKASTGMTCPASSNTTTFAATSGIKTINTAGVTFDRPFTFDGVGGTFQLQAALTSGATRTCTLTNGTLDLAGYTLTTGVFSSTNSNTRSIAFDSTGKFVLTATTGTVLSMSNATNFTYTGTSRIELTASGAGRTIVPNSIAAVESNVLNIYVTTGSDTLTASGAARFLNFDLTGFAGTLTSSSSMRFFGDLVFSSGMTVGSLAGTLVFAKTSGTQTITSAGKTIDQVVTVEAPGAIVRLQDALTLGSTRTFTLTNGTLDLASYTLTTGAFSSNNSNTRSIAFGTGSIVITSNSGTVWSCATLTNFSYTGNSNVNLTYSGSVGTRSLSHGNIATGTEARAINFNISAGTDAVTLNSTFFANNLNFTGFAGTLTSSNRNIYGNLILSSGMTLNSGVTAVTTFAATSGTKTITSNGKTMDFLVIFNGVGGTWSLQDALTLGSTQTLTLTNGALNSNNYTITTSTFSSTGNGIRSLSLSGNLISLTSTGTVWTTSGTGFSMGATDRISLASASTQTLSGGGVSLGTLVIGDSNAKTITGSSSFYNIVNTVVPATVNFEAGSTNSFSNFNLNGVVGSLVTLRSTVPGSTYTLAKI